MRVYWSDREGKSAPIAARFACIPFSPHSASPFKEIDGAIASLPLPQTVIVKKRTFLPDKAEWIEKVKTALSQNIKKVVLARCQILELSSSPDPFALTAALNRQTEGSYLFCMQEGKKAFLGASPERLFCRKGDKIFSEAMAGTRRRGNTVEEDERLGQELLESAKDRSEFQPVTEFLKTTLPPFCEGPLAFTPLSLHRTKNVQHLYTKCEALLRKDVKDQDLIEALHPTPALCGTPKESAFALIRSLEPFDRGLYGGAIGWTSPGASEWIVGIRSCWIEENRAYLYAGAGIVQGSDPEAEWEELNCKSKLYERIFLDH